MLPANYDGDAMIDAFSVARFEPLNGEGVSSQVARDGFAIVEHVVPPELVNSLSAAIDQVERDDAVRIRKGRAFAIRNALDRLPQARVVAALNSVAELAQICLPGPPRITRAIIFDKNPQANWMVPWHQDTTIAVRERIETPGFGPWSVKAGVVHVQPPAAVLERMITLRIHLDDCDTSNGPLVVLPGTHSRGILSDEAIKECTGVAPLVTCTGGPGSAVVMRPLLLHASSAAAAPRRRRILHLEFAGEELLGRLRWSVA